MQERGEGARGQHEGREGEEGKVCNLFIMCTISLKLLSKGQMVSKKCYLNEVILNSVERE